MSKKFIPIIAGVVAVIAIVIIAIIGSNPDIFNKTIYVNQIKITNEVYDTYEEDGVTISRILMDDDNTTEVLGKKTFEITYEVLPEKATDKTVTFTSSDSTIATVSTEGVVTFLEEESVFVTLKSNDKSAKTATVQLMWPAEKTSNLSVSLDDGNLNFEKVGDNKLFAAESEALYLYKGVEYIFASDAEIEISTTDVAEMDSKVLTTSKLGTFDLSFKFDEETTKTKRVVVLEYINNFGYGAYYSEYKNTTANLATNDNFLNKTAQEYEVGAGNAYYFDTNIQNAEFQNVALADAHLAYSVKKVEGTTKTDVDANDVFTVGNDGKLTFKSAAVGNVYEVAVAPKYNFLNKSALTFRFKVVEGVNVWTHDELRSNFADLNVNAIVMHKNILAVAAADQLAPDGRLMDRGYLFEDGKKILTGDIYARGISTTDRTSYANLDVSLSGNYFKIDGSKLPYLTLEQGVNPADGYDYSSHNLIEWAKEAGYECANIQTGIFKFQDDTQDAMEVNDKNRKVANFNVKNLVLEGNTSTGLIYPDDGELNNEEAEQIALQGSSSAGFMQRGAIRLNSENVAVIKTGVGLYNAGSHGGVNTKYTLVYDSWGNGVFGWRTGKFEFEDTKIIKAGGAAICMTDATHSTALSEEWLDGYIKFGKNTVVENYVAGTEGYFIVNGLSTVVPALKAQLNPQLAGMNKTMLKTVQGADGEYSVFNFILQLSPSSGTQCTEFTHTFENVGAEGWTTYIDGLTFKREGDNLVCLEDPNKETFALYGDNKTKCDVVMKFDSQIVIDYYDEATDSFVRFERKDGYYDVDNYPMMASGNGLEGVSKISNIDDAYLVAGLVASYDPQDYDPSVSGSVDHLLAGDAEIVNIINNLNSQLDPAGPQFVSIKSVIDANIAAAIAAGVDPSNTQQYMMAVCRSNILDVIETNKALYDMILANETYQDRHDEVQYLIAGFDMVVSNAKQNSSLANLCVAMTCTNDLLSIKNREKDINLLNLKIVNSQLGEFSGIVIQVELMPL